VARTATVRDTVVPHTIGDGVYCECGSPMRPWQYVEYPSRHRWIMWRCQANPDHITCMVPEYRRR